VSTWVKAGEGNIGALWALIFTFVGMFLFSLVWSASWWPPAPQTMTGQINAPALQLGFANAQTLQDKLGVPAIVFGLVQAALLFALYRGILRKERPSTRSTSGIRRNTRRRRWPRRPLSKPDREEAQWGCSDRKRRSRK
jgi:hypothetical protein